MPHWRLLVPSNWVGAHDLPDSGAVVEIEAVSLEEIDLVAPGGKREKKKKAAIRLRGKEKRLLAGVTVLASIAAMHGKKTEGWIGKQIEIYPTECRGVGGAMVECVRARPAKTKTGGAA
jgi:hypothetical protein